MKKCTKTKTKKYIILLNAKEILPIVRIIQNRNRLFTQQKSEKKLERPNRMHSCARILFKIYLNGQSSPAEFKSL